jgi:hypothetical protein
VDLGLPGIPPVNHVALRADRGFAAAVGLDDRPVQDDVRQALLAGALERLAQHALLLAFEPVFLTLLVASASASSISNRGVARYGTERPGRTGY